MIQDHIRYRLLRAKETYEDAILLFDKQMVESLLKPVSDFISNIEELVNKE